MRIQDLGGEFALIDRLVQHTPASHPDLRIGVGDDAAVISGTYSNGDFLLVTTDMLVEGTHFRRDWSTPQQIGVKAVACNVSDIAAMGGTPTFMFASLALAQKTEVGWAEALYTGMADACRRYRVVLAGGDTTQSARVTISITVLGRVSRSHLRSRDQALPGDLLCVTGPLGGAAAGLALLAAGLPAPPDLRDKHLAPACRLDVAPRIAPLAHAMIDISDGLAAETHHICNRSGTGAQLVAGDIPLHPGLPEAARLTGGDPLQWALSGGEDFELLFSISAQNARKLAAAGVAVSIIGRITDTASSRTLKMPDGRMQPLPGGYDHFGPTGRSGSPP